MREVEFMPELRAFPVGPYLLFTALPFNILYTGQVSAWGGACWSKDSVIHCVAQVKLRREVAFERARASKVEAELARANRALEHRGVEIHALKKAIKVCAPFQNGVLASSLPYDDLLRYPIPRCTRVQISKHQPRS